MNHPQTVFFIGKPGSGKGTQAKKLAAKTGWIVKAAGEQFREMAKEESVLGKRIREDLDNGLLMPHWLAMYLYQRALFSVKDEDSVIFDGFNRKVPEAELNIATMQWIGRPFTVLNIEVSNDEVRRRLEGRAQNQGRGDDHQDAVEERLDEYETHTTKTIEIFKNLGVLIDINGEQDPEAVFADVLKALHLD